MGLTLFLSLIERKAFEAFFILRNGFPFISRFSSSSTSPLLAM